MQVHSFAVGFKKLVHLLYCPALQTELLLCAQI